MWVGLCRVGSMHMQFVMRKVFAGGIVPIYIGAAGERDLYRWERLTGMTWHLLKADVAKFMAQKFL